jgi:hypothetical protein
MHVQDSSKGNEASVQQLVALITEMIGTGASLEVSYNTLSILRNHIIVYYVSVTSHNSAYYRHICISVESELDCQQHSKLMPSCSISR